MPEADDEGLPVHVARVLRRIWDPIDLGRWGPEDEYDSYVPGVIALVQDTTVFETGIVAHLQRIETMAMGLAPTPVHATRAARALLGLREASKRSPALLVAQAISLDGLHCLWVFRRSDGFYAYEHATLRHEVDENGSCSWWADAGEGRSGLFATAEAAEQEARGAIGWLR